ncbi:DUF982 domain-containing protein [Neoaquamicrobium sediminum]|uniref:DUF982 domain-containing protein n=1 Tax=Neoaquamicrobium sediminum TaxID=1849104 RepID=UPI0028ACB342|nr:DUF982 domain-containing protein [Mesorhizobium sediminum]
MFASCRPQKYAGTPLADWPWAALTLGMSKLRFHKPVRVQPGRIDRDKVVLSTKHAAEILLRDWPDRGQKKRERAMRACLEVIKGRKPPSYARKRIHFCRTRCPNSAG